MQNLSNTTMKTLTLSFIISLLLLSSCKTVRLYPTKTACQCTANFTASDINGFNTVLSDYLNAEIRNASNVESVKKVMVIEVSPSLKKSKKKRFDEIEYLLSEYFKPAF